MVTRNESPYGLLRPETLPDAPYAETLVPGLPDREVVTSDLAYAKNHCAATAIANLALSFAKRDAHEPLCATPPDTLRDVYEMVGNGPILFFRRKAERYFHRHGKSVSLQAVSRRDISAALRRGNICALLLRDGLFRWHWVLAVGERVYDSGKKYLRVMDGWHRGHPRYLAVGRRSSIVYALECAMKMV